MSFRFALILVFAITLLSLSAKTVYAQEGETMTLSELSDEGTFDIEIDWIAGEPGEQNIFDIRFIDPETQIEIEDVIYDIMILQDGNTVRGTLRPDQTSLQQKYVFDHVGSYVLLIDDIEGLGEGVSIPIEVTPEFPGGIAAIAGLSFAVLLASIISSRYFAESR